MEEKVYERMIQTAHKPKKHKIAVFVCGASGTGKTTMRYKFLRDAKIKTSFVYLNLDDIKEVGREEARTILDYAIVRAIDDGYSIFYDGTCRNKQFMQKLIKHLKSKDYKVVMGMTYTTLPTALRRLEERRGQYISEADAKDVYQHMTKNAEVYMDTKDIDEIYLYTNEETSTLIFKRNAKEVECVLPNERFYFDVSKYC